MKFGVFDHMDDAGIPHGELFAGRLRLAEAYDRAGFHGYHLAEHHGTPIGCAASPGIFLAALAQRTEKLRFGPLVYLLPFYHPLRLIEEICMLDQLSGGRLRARHRPRRVAVRDRELRARLFANRRDVPRGVPGAAQGPRRRRADLRRQILSLRQSADGAQAGAAPASAAVVRRQHSRQRRLAGGKRRQRRVAGAAGRGASDLRALPRDPPQARQGRHHAARRRPPCRGRRHR